MAVDLWVTDSASVADHRFVLCVQTSDLLYALAEVAPPAADWSPNDPVPLWVLTASTAEGALPFGGGTVTDIPGGRLIVVVHGAPGPDDESLTLTLYDDELTVWTDRVVRATGAVALPGVTLWLADPPPPDPSSSIVTDLDGVLLVDGVRDYRALIGLETAEMFYVLVEGPTGRQPLPPATWTARASSPAGELPLISFSSSQRKRHPFIAYPTFAPPGPDIRALDVEVLGDGEVLMRSQLVRSGY